MDPVMPIDSRLHAPRFKSTTTTNSSYIPDLSDSISRFSEAPTDGSQVTREEYNGPRIPTPRTLVDDVDVLRRFHNLDQSYTIEDQMSYFLHKLTLPPKTEVAELVGKNCEVGQRDCYDFDAIDEQQLHVEPMNYIVFGKPGVGSTTVSKIIAEKQFLVHIDACEIARNIDSYTETKAFPPPSPEEVVFEVISNLITGLDVKERGYILDGLPLPFSVESIELQMEYLRKLPLKPTFVILLQMHDDDLLKRRTEQKYDPETGIVYSRTQYMDLNRSSKILASLEGSPLSSMKDVISSLKMGRWSRSDPASYSSIDELGLASEILGRLLTRTEDLPGNVHSQFATFNGGLDHIQDYINEFDGSQVFEISAYASIQQLTENGVLATGFMMPVSAPRAQRLFTPPPSDVNVILSAEDAPLKAETEKLELLEECPPDPNDPRNLSKSQPKENVDWPAIYKAAAYMNAVDSRFKRHLSRWKNLCPVALKEGRSKVGRPELAYGFLDKMYFLNSPEDAEKFTQHPKYYLKPMMPTSPVKLVIIGHPFAGKTTFAKQLACISGGKYIDMKIEIVRWLEACKQMFLFQARFEATQRAKIAIYKEMYDEWVRHEFIRRNYVREWIAEYHRQQELNKEQAALRADQEERMARYRKLRGQSEYHELEAGQGDFDSNNLAFSLNKFTEELKPKEMSHQERLELAWKLFREHNLHYKKKPRSKRTRSRRTRGAKTDDDEEAGESQRYRFDSTLSWKSVKIDAGEDGEEEEAPMKRKLKKCPELLPTRYTDSAYAFKTPPDGDPEWEGLESDEALALLYPTMCPELLEAAPKPLEIAEDHDLVQAYVASEVKKMEDWLATFPCELYLAILTNVIKVAEEQFRIKYPEAHETGGWVIDNLDVDVDKWRCVLENQETCPDQVFVLQDAGPAYKELVARWPLAAERNRTSNWFFDDLAPGPESDDDDSNGKMFALRNTASKWDNSNGGSRNFAYDEVRGWDDSDEEIGGGVMDRIYASIGRVSVDEQLINRDLRRQQSKELNLEVALAKCSLERKERWKSSSDKCESYWYSRETCPSFHNLVQNNFGLENDMIVVEPASFFEDQEHMLSCGFQSKQNTNLYDYMLGVPPNSYAQFNTAVSPEDFNEPLPEVLQPPEEVFGEQENKIQISNYAEQKALEKLHGEIKTFNDLWVQLKPILEKAKIDHWQVGPVDPLNVVKVAEHFWSELESRFDAPAVAVTSKELDEEDRDIIDSYNKWGGIPMNLADEDEDAGEDGTAELEPEGTDQRSALIPAVLNSVVQDPDEFCLGLGELEQDRFFGNVSFYCPVTLVEESKLIKSNSRFASRFQNKLYYLKDAEAQKKFFKDPFKYVKTPPHCIPPPRIAITGTPGCRQFDMASKIAREAGIYCIDFRQLLQDVIKAKLGRSVGPLETAEIAISGEPEASPEDAGERKFNHEPQTYSELLQPEDFDFGRGFNLQTPYSVYKNASSTSNILSYELDGIEASELRASKVRQTLQLTFLERQIKAFLETGETLPWAVLDEYLRPFWEVQPFKFKGFIIVGFPNTVDDLKYLESRNLYFEKIYVLQCLKNTMKNRLLASLLEKTKFLDTKCNPFVIRNYTLDEIKNLLRYRPSNDISLAKASTVLQYVHHISTKGLHNMKSYMNQYSFNWTVISTDASLMEAENELRNNLLPRLQERYNIFERTYPLYLDQAEELLSSGYFQLSRFKRWCPVESYKGNWAINMWNPSKQAIHVQPVLHRKFIYFVAGNQNMTKFSQRTLRVIQNAVTPPLKNPVIICVLGKPFAGKTALCHRIAKNLSLQYMPKEHLPYRVLRHTSFANGPEASTSPMIFGQRVLSYLKEGFAIPDYMSCICLDFWLRSLQSQCHGIVFDEYPDDCCLMDNLLQRGIMPDLVINLEIGQKDTSSRADENRLQLIEEDQEIAYVPNEDKILQLQYQTSEDVAKIFGTAQKAGRLMALCGEDNPEELAQKVLFKLIENQTGATSHGNNYCISESKLPNGEMMEKTCSNFYKLDSNIEPSESFAIDSISCDE